MILLCDNTCENIKNKQIKSKKTNLDILKKSQKNLLFKETKRHSKKIIFSLDFKK